MRSFASVSVCIGSGVGGRLRPCACRLLDNAIHGLCVFEQQGHGAFERLILARAAFGKGLAGDQTVDGKAHRRWRDAPKPECAHVIAQRKAIGAADGLDDKARLRIGFVLFEPQAEPRFARKALSGFGNARLR